MHEVPWGPEAAGVTARVTAPLHGSHNQTLSRSRTDEDLPLQELQVFPILTGSKELNKLKAGDFYGTT